MEDTLRYKQCAMALLSCPIPGLEGRCRTINRSFYLSLSGMNGADLMPAAAGRGRVHNGSGEEKRPFHSKTAGGRASAEGRREWLFVPSSYSTMAKGYTHTAILFTPQLQTPHGRCDRAFAEGCQKQPLEFVVWLEALKFCANANCVAGALTSSLPSSDLRFGLGC